MESKAVLWTTHELIQRSSLCSREVCAVGDNPEPTHGVETRIQPSSRSTSRLEWQNGSSLGSGLELQHL